MENKFKGVFFLETGVKALKTVEVQTEKKKTVINKRFFSSLFIESMKFILIFFISRTSLFYVINPFSATVMLAFGGGIFNFLAALAGAYSAESFEAVFYILTSYVLKFFLKNEKFDIITVTVGGIIVYTSIISQNNFNLYDIILRLLCLLIAIGSYYPMKTAYKSQFLKSRVLKFTKKETYCSVFLLFCFIAGISDGIVYFTLNFSNIFKVYTLLLCADCFGVGTASSFGAIMGILSGNNFNKSTVYMSYYSIMGLMSGIFAKFSRVTSVLGLLCTFFFSYAYMQEAYNAVSYTEMIAASLLFLITPSKIIKEYFKRYTKEENTANMLSTVNTVAASRLNSLSKSFFSLSDKINVMPSKKNTMINLNTDSLCDFLGEKVCSKCTLKSICWDKHRDETSKSLENAIKTLYDGGNLSEKDFDTVFEGRCVKIGEIIALCKSFFDILKVNAVWKRKMNENAKAFKQQFVEMSEIICDMKKSIETNKYYEAELSADIFSAISYEGYLIKDVVVIKDATGAFFVKVSLEHCFEKKNCAGVIKNIIEDVLGIYMVKCEGGCTDSICTLLFREGSVGKLEKRVYSISKKTSSPEGDSYVIKRISPNKYLVALCDGMGSGEEAHEISSCVTDLLSDMLAAGFSEESTYKIINSFVIFNLSGLGFTTMDFMVIDTKNMTAKIVKKGACPTYIKRGANELFVVENKSMPAGMIWQKPYVKTVNIMKNDIIVMMSDGAIDAIPDKDWIKNILSKNISSNLNECVDLIYSVAQKDCDKKEDDITVLGVSIV